jgi:hypothetical protein
MVFDYFFMSISLFLLFWKLLVESDRIGCAIINSTGKLVNIRPTMNGFTAENVL